MQKRNHPTHSRQDEKQMANLSIQAETRISLHCSLTSAGEKRPQMPSAKMLRSLKPTEASGDSELSLSMSRAIKKD